MALVLGQKHRVDVGQDSAGRDGDLAEELVELFVVADGELDVAGDDAGLLVVAGGVAGKLEHLGGQVLQHGRQVHRRAGSDTGGELAPLQEAADTRHRELQPSLRGPDRQK